MHGGEALGERTDARMAELFEKARLELVHAQRAVEAQQFAQAADLLLKVREKYGPATPPEADEMMRRACSRIRRRRRRSRARDREAASRREAEAAAALDVARMLVERDAKRAHAALQKVASDYPDTDAAKTADVEANAVDVGPEDARRRSKRTRRRSRPSGCSCWRTITAATGCSRRRARSWTRW